jgi:hypothetical protein
LASKVFINGYWEFTDLSKEYKKGWLNFCDDETRKCLQKNIEMFIKWSNLIKSTDSMMSLKAYRFKLQRYILHKKKNNRLTTLMPELDAKLTDKIEKKGQSKASSHLTQAIIRILIMNDNLLANKPKDDEAGIIVS